MISVHFFGGSQLAAAGIISEYLGRTLEQVKGRPLYLLRSACGFPRPATTGTGAVPAPHFPLSAARQTAAPPPEERDGITLGLPRG
jgi:hypothetical protein